MTKQLRKAIMHHSKIKNVFNKSHARKTWDSCKKTAQFLSESFKKNRKCILKIPMLRIRVRVKSSGRQ